MASEPAELTGPPPVPMLPPVADQRADDAPGVPLPWDETSWRRGLLGAVAVPAHGETFTVVHEGDGVIIEEITSSDAVEQVPYDQAHDEWVVVMSGSASLTIEGEQVDLGAGEWLFLPAGTSHTVTRTEHGTRWLAVHLPPPPPH